MDNLPESDNNNALIGMGKHLKVIAEQQIIIAEQQKRQTDYLRNISAALTFMTLAVVFILLVLAYC